jgi:c-di-GMP-binding flagellar brake protein YcgR
MEERRRYKRWQIEKSVQCRFQENTQNCFLKEISYKGVSISLEATQIDLGKSCALTIAIVNELEPLNISCDIVWQRNINNNLELGLYFTRIKDKDKERIFRYVFDHFPEQILKQWWQGVD